MPLYHIERGKIPPAQQLIWNATVLLIGETQVKLNTLPRSFNELSLVCKVGFEIFLHIKYFYMYMGVVFCIVSYFCKTIYMYIYIIYVHFLLFFILIL